MKSTGEMEMPLEMATSIVPKQRTINYKVENPMQLRLARFGFQVLGRLMPKQTARVAYRLFSTPRLRAKHRKSDEIIDSARVIDFDFKNQTVKLYEWGDGDKVVLLAHGWESRGTALRDSVPRLVAKGFKVVAFDAIAHGDSTGKRNNLYTNGATVAAIMAHYGGIYGAICHSFGCSSLIYALQFINPQLSVERVVFIAVPPATKIIMSNFLKMMSVPKAAENAYYELIEKMAGRKIEAIDVATASGEVRVGKLLLFHDRYDEVTAIEAAERVVAQWDNAELRVTEGFGHFKLAKNPVVVKQIVDFIDLN
jgi:pimeloyl-ACP methyl ester carboxylesterase